MLKTEGVNHVIAQSVNHVSLDMVAARNLTGLTRPGEWGNVILPCPIQHTGWFHEVSGRCEHRPLH